MQGQKQSTDPLKVDRIAERLIAQAHILETMAAETWNEETAGKIAKLIQECKNTAVGMKSEDNVVGAEWPKPPTF